MRARQLKLEAARRRTRPHVGTMAAPAGMTTPFLALQQAIGNRAISRLLDLRSVQRCGPTTCDCSPEERTEWELRARADSAVAQRSVAEELHARVQRAVSADFKIRGKWPGAPSESSTLFFDVAERTPDAVESAKIPPLASPPGRALTLKGTASEEGGAGANAAVVADRIAAVSSLLAAAGHTGVRTVEARPTAGVGNINYRRARVVEIRPTGAPSPTPDCSAGAAPNDCGPTPSPFTTALARGHMMIAAARSKIAGPPDPATTALLTRLFGGIGSVGTIDANLALIDGQLTNMVPFTPTHGHQCVNTCDALCGAGATAYNIGDGPTAMMTLCPVFVSEPDLDERAAVLIHEGSHGTTGLTTGDQSYTWQRLITQLPPALALSNADSYTAFIRLATSPGSITLGPSAPDTHSGGMTPPEQAAADRSVAWLEQWIMGTQSEVSALYGVAHESIAAGSWTNSYYEATMTFVAPVFGLTAPPARPRKSDKVALAGIADRYEQLLNAVSRPLDLKKVGMPGTSWTPGPGTTVNLGATFFGLSARDQVTALLTALIAVQPAISPARAPHYIATVHNVEAHAGLGSP